MTKTKFPNGDNKSPNGNNQHKKLFLHEFALRLQQAAHACNLNQARLARLLDLPSSSINRYWNGDRLPPADLLFSLADCLAVDPRWLVFGEARAFDAQAKEDDEVQLLDAFRQLSENNRAHVVATARLLGDGIDRTGTERPSSSLHGERTPYRSR